MLSKIPFDLERIKKKDVDREILRGGIIAELDAINLYEQMAAMTQNSAIRRILLEIAREEKTHVGEFQALLLREDKEQERELRRGGEEAKGLTGI
ncbi:MAG: rubrerythrin [Nitrospirae bacterium]|nr:rubrerythrin [Nitrospirota bacterium]